MISISRELARRLRTILRKAAAGRIQKPSLEIHCRHSELRIRAELSDVGLEYKQPGPLAEDSLLVPFEALEEIEGKSEALVTLTKVSKDGVEAAWDDGGIPRRKTYFALDKPPAIPDVDWADKVEVPGFLEALAGASRCVSPNTSSFALTHIQVRGAAGEVIGTDGRQALIQSGFTFPWKEDLLIPSLAVYGCRELFSEGDVSVVRNKTHLALQVGSWTLFLLLDTQGRYPNVAASIAPGAAATILRLSVEDMDFLKRSLAKLPGKDQDGSPITVDLNGQATIRAKEDNQQPTEVVLAGSQVNGKPVSFCTDRRYLAHAIALGFSEFLVAGADKPIHCKDATRIYGWMPLSGCGIIPANGKATRISTQPATSSPSISERQVNDMAQPQANGETAADGAVNGAQSASRNGASTHVDSDASSNGMESVIAEAQALRDYLREGYIRSAHLVTAIKRQRKKSKLLSSTLASLRQLQQIEA